MEAPIQALGVPTRMPVLRGHGADTPHALRGVAWQDWVDDAEAALRDLLSEAERAVVVGHSMGGLVAITLGANQARDDCLDSLVLAAPGVQAASPLAPGRPLSFLLPIVVLIKDRHIMPPVRADKSLEQYDTNYPWAPVVAVKQFLDFSIAARARLLEITAPTLILQSRNDSTIAPESATIVHDGISTADSDKRIVWFEKTEHEMFRDLEADAVVAAVAAFVGERVAARDAG